MASAKYSLSVQANAGHGHGHGGGGSMGRISMHKKYNAPSGLLFAILDEAG